MKKTYEKPTLQKRDRLGTVAAEVIIVSGPVA
ncbi:putative RiPP precursor [Mesorhizobium sp. M2A.F.Ca.ET.043.05.1.1]|nr:putative RiPP precursor [Mesorhizobium sp. M2A.F.Ca.ET.043.05.1.1]RUX27809.1 putative RiPP precursor [Mesorhizobium sp. M2A.F.Ca.ET.042.01.1.1]